MLFFWIIRQFIYNLSYLSDCKRKPLTMVGCWCILSNSIFLTCEESTSVQEAGFRPSTDDITTVAMSALAESPLTPHFRSRWITWNGKMKRSAGKILLQYSRAKWCSLMYASVLAIEHFKKKKRKLETFSFAKLLEIFFFWIITTGFTRNVNYTFLYIYLATKHWYIICR